MSRRTQEIVFGVSGQVVYLDCPDGRPTSVVDVQCWSYASDDTATEEACFTGSASIDSTPNTTIDVISGASQTDPTKVYVTATSGAAVGRRYLLTSGKGHSEWFEVASIVSGDYLVAKHPLVNDYEITTSTVESTRVSHAMSSTWVAEVAKLSPPLTPNPRYRVRWTLAIDGFDSNQVYETAFDLVRYTAQHHVSPLDVAQRHPNWLDYLPPDDRSDQGRSLIDRAWQAFKFDLCADNKADQAIRNPEAIDQLVIVKAVVLDVEDRVLRGAASALEAEAADRIYRQRYDQLLRSPVLAMDPTGGGGAVALTPTPLWRR
jgi:hypothetical protein